ncbi:MAG: AAA family ATPase, partial [Chloroflexi bacterium]|nr:AAA family ATPase [Chloroflexota bacterium]
GLQARPGPVRGLAGLVSPMVGRDAELTALCRVARDARAGAGRVALVVGEPGLGKSRLIAEWRAAAAEAVAVTESVRWTEGRCLSYGQDLAYHLLIDLLRNIVGVPVAAGEPEARAALLALVQNLLGDNAPDVYPYLAHLLALGLDDETTSRVRALDPQTLQAQYLVALRRLLLALAARQPCVLVFEDIHWADPASVDLSIKLLPLAAEAPLLFCFVTRPERDVPGWKLVTAAREQVGATELILRALSPDDSQQLIANLLAIEALPAPVRALIAKKAEGNPFFVEEIIRMLIDQEIIVREGGHWIARREIDSVEIPDNVQGLLLARIDRLPDDVKRTLRVASVIGRQFAASVLGQVLERQGVL